MPDGVGLVSLKVGVVCDVVGLLHSDDDAVSDVCSQTAVVRVVGGADEGEAGVIPVLVSVDGLPISIRIVLKRVRNINGH